MNLNLLVCKRRRNIIAFKNYLILFLLQLSFTAGSFAQSSPQEKRVTLNYKQIRTSVLIKAIKEQTGYDFNFSPNDVDQAKIGPLNYKNTPLSLVFKELGQFGLNFRISGKTVSVSYLKPKVVKPVQAAQKTQEQISLKGKVIAEDDDLPILGANISGNGKFLGRTDLNGSFAITVAKNTEITVSYMGYDSNKMIVAGDDDGLEIILKSSSEGLNDVVVVGYGAQKRANVIGSVVQIGAAELRTSPTGNLSAMLQGKLPGLITRQSSGQPGLDGATLLIRGYNTLGSNAPLVIVDGFERDFPQINPDEIEAITVLKDAASAAVYGVRAANGVIMITTKRGSVQKPTISYSSSFSASSNTNFPTFLDGPEYAYWYNKAQEMDGIAEASRRFSPDEISRITNGDPQGVFQNTDWFDLLFKSYAPVYTNNLSLSGGAEKYKYFISLGSYNQQGSIDRTSYDRYNVRANIDAQILNNLNLSVNLALKDDNTKEPGLSAGIGNDYASIFSQAMMSYPFLPAYNAAGMPIASLNTGNGNQNPLAARDLSGLQHTRTSRFQGSMALKYDLSQVPGLSFKINAAYDKGYSLQKAYLLPYLLSVYNTASRTFTESYSKSAPSGDASLNQWFADSWQSTFQPSITYDKKFNKHALSGLLLYEYMRKNNESMSGGRKGYPITDIMDLNYGEEVIDNLVKGAHSMFHRAGYVSRLNYGYADKYLFEFTSRLDGSPRLPAKNRWGFFPAVSLGWRISEEPFFKEKLNFMDYLKLRGSVGKLGNDAIGDYAYLRTLSLGVDPVVMIGDKLSRPLSVSSVPNENIKWETTTAYNVGLESSMWNGKLGVEGDVFYRVTKNILQSQSGVMPPSLGGYFPSTVNSGVVDSRGFELILTHRNRIGEFGYQVKGNLSWARNKIIETTEDVNTPDYLRKTGKQIGLKYGFVADGIFQSQEEIDNSALFGPARVGEVKLKDLNGDGRITYEQDWTVIGKSDIPEMMFGLNVGGNYKAFDFNVFFQGAAMADVALSGLYPGKTIYDNTFYTMPFYQDGNSPKYLVEDSWTPENTDAKYPRLSTLPTQSGGKFSSFWIRNGAYLRLKSAQIGYTLPAMLSKKINIQKIRLQLTGSNLFTISGLDYLDPEMPSVNQGYYPQQRLFEFGLNVTL